MSKQTVSSALRQEALNTLATHGKTFYWAAFFLGKDRAALAALLYTSCRQLDDIADEPGKGNELRRCVLEQIKSEIAQSAPTQCHQVSAAWRQLIQLGVDAEAVSMLIEGLIQDTHLVFFRQQRDLDRYCYRVAGTVGIMMCAVLGVRNREAIPYAIDLGIAMQLTNICRDVLEDASLGRRYLPIDVPVEMLRTAQHESRHEVVEAIDAQLVRAEQFYKSALSGLIYLPRGSRVAIYLAAILYRAIGHKLRARQYAWWKGRVIVSGAQKLLITLGALPAMIRLCTASKLKPDSEHSRALHRHLEGMAYADDQAH